MVPHPSGMIYEKVIIFDSTLSSRKVVPHPSSMNYKKVGIFDSTLSYRKVVPHPSGMIYKKVGIFDSTLSSRKVVPHPSSSCNVESTYSCTYLCKSCYVCYLPYLPSPIPTPPVSGGWTGGGWRWDWGCVGMGLGR